MLLYPLILFVLLQLHLLSAFPVLKRPFHAEKSSTTRNFKIAETMEQNQPAEAVGGHNGLMNPFHDPEPGLADSLQPDEDTDEEDGSHYQIHLVQPDRTLLSHTVFHIMHVFHLQMDQATAIFEEGLESGTAFIKEVPTLVSPCPSPAPIALTRVSG